MKSTEASPSAATRKTPTRDSVVAQHVSLLAQHYQYRKPAGASPGHLAPQSTAALPHSPNPDPENAGPMKVE
jgi:hypothetical protein